MGTPLPAGAHPVGVEREARVEHVSDGSKNGGATEPTTGNDAPFEVEVSTKPGHTVIVVRGEVDVFTSPRLRQVLFDPVLCSQPKVVVDLDEVTFMDSTGIGTLVAARRWAASRDSEIALVCTEGPALRLLEIVSLNRVFDVHESVDAATAAR